MEKYIIHKKDKLSTLDEDILLLIDVKYTVNENDIIVYSYNDYNKILRSGISNILNINDDEY